MTYFSYLIYFLVAPVISLPLQNRENFTQNDVIFGCGVSAYLMLYLKGKEKADKIGLPADDRRTSVQVCELSVQHTLTVYVFVDPPDQVF